jgi:hypothetical protein
MAQIFTLRSGSELFRVLNGIQTVLFENFRVFLIYTDIAAFLILVEKASFHIFPISLFNNQPKFLCILMCYAEIVVEKSM